MRGAERPAGVKWTRPFLVPLPPLSGSAATEMFMDIAGDAHSESGVQKLLDLTGNLPLAVSLISHVAAQEGCDGALSRWNSEKTQMLSDGYDKRSSLDISIMLSFTSFRMTEGAQQLLSILSMLPDGLADADLAQIQIPVANILTCKATLIQTSLAFIGQDQRLKVLVPIREHINQVHPATKIMQLLLRQHFHRLLDLWNKFHTLNTADVAPQIIQNIGNLHSLLFNALKTECSDAIQNFYSILFLNKFYRRIYDACSPLLANLSEEIVHWADQPIFGDYLIQLFESAPYSPVADAEAQIQCGEQYFQSKHPLELGMI